MDLMTFQESIKKCGCPRNKILHLITSSENNLIEIHIARSPPQNSLSVQLFSLDMRLCQHFLPHSLTAENAFQLTSFLVSDLSLRFKDKLVKVSFCH